ncbi:MAG: ABC transporter permease subunit, partial [Mycobacteriales bacterium]
HGLSMPIKDASARSVQLSEIFGRGGMFGTLFAALLGAMSITGEFRHGTIRPTFLLTPQRGRIIAAKVWASMLIGAAFGLIAMTFAAGVGSAALAWRGVNVELDGGDYALLLTGGAAAAALWAAIGVGVGTIVRNQVPTTVAICTWLLFVEGLLAGDAGVIGDASKYLPGALGNAASGQVELVAPVLGVLLLALYAAAAATAGWRATTRRDVA